MHTRRVLVRESIGARHSLHFDYEHRSAEHEHESPAPFRNRESFLKRTIA